MSETSKIKRTRTVTPPPGKDNERLIKGQKKGDSKVEITKADGQEQTKEVKLSGRMGIVKGPLSRAQRAKLRKLKDIYSADHRHKDRWTSDPLPIELLEEVGIPYEPKK